MASLMLEVPTEPYGLALLCCAIKSALCAEEGTVHQAHAGCKSVGIRTTQPMKTKSFSIGRLICIASCVTLTTGYSQTALFTTDTAIGIHDTNFDGVDIVVSNATLTIDGYHSFSSIHLLNLGRLTHSSSINGLLENRINIARELHSLCSTNATALNTNNVITNTVTLRASSGHTYVLDANYLLTTSNGTILITLPSGSTITDGTSVLVDYDALLTPVTAGLYLTVSSNVEVEAGGMIDANGHGFGAGMGPGAAQSSYPPFTSLFQVGGGGGHGG